MQLAINVKLIFPSTHVVYEGISKVKKDIKEDEETKPVLSILIVKSINEKQLKSLEKLYNFKTWDLFMDIQMIQCV